MDFFDPLNISTKGPQNGTRRGHALLQNVIPTFEIEMRTSEGLPCMNINPCVHCTASFFEAFLKVYTPGKLICAQHVLITLCLKW